MQESLQNPQFKKIWEKVIMNNNPTAKSLEEALDMEKEKDDCGLLLKDSIFTHNNMVGIKSANIALKTANLSYAKIKDIMGAEFKILGRPITLEDILILFTKTYNEIYFFDTARISNGREYRCFIKLKHNTPDVSESVKYGKIEWQLTKPLHEQTPETWEKIANLI